MKSHGFFANFSMVNLSYKRIFCKKHLNGLFFRIFENQNNNCDFLLITVYFKKKQLTSQKAYRQFIKS